MKKIIDNSGGMVTVLTIEPMTAESHKHWRHVKISTVYEHSERDSSREQIQWQMCMDDATFKNFCASINEMSNL